MICPVDGHSPRDAAYNSTPRAGNNRFRVLAYPRDLEAHFFQKSADLCRLVALHLNGAISNCASGPEGMAKVAREIFQSALGEGRREIVDHDDGPATALSGFAPEDDAPQ